MIYSLSEYFAKLREHDWYYDFSDDPHVWKRGNTERKHLEAASASSKLHEKMWDAFNAYYFNGEPWGTKKPPMPKLEDFEKEVA